jgi:predicted dehydrogenase
VSTGCFLWYADAGERVRVLIEDRWRGGFLDYWLSPDDVRLRVVAMQNIERLDADLFFVRPRSVRLLANYLVDRGAIDVARKVRSRLQEVARNHKFLSRGIGLVLEAPGELGLARLSPVVFLAPAHPECVDRLVLASALVRPIPSERLGDLRGLSVRAGQGEFVHHLPLGSEALTELGGAVRGWNSMSGMSLQGGDLATVLAFAEGALTTDWTSARRLPVGGDGVATRRQAPRPRSRAARAGRPVGVLFGYGNYAKTTILPHLERDIDIRSVHEIDPLQIPMRELGQRGWDTAPLPSEDERFDVLISAGYHSTHASHAAAALAADAHAVIEKPIAVDGPQLHALLDAMANSSANVYCCFQRRYSPFNDYAMRDLKAAEGEPISYHCIVYEVPLPPLHWYRWPASGSRLVSNGCHWVDHFLYLNHYSAVVARDVRQARDESVHCVLELENGAAFSMVLTDLGSERLGVRDHVELRRGCTTVVIEDNKTYRAESSAKTLRRARISKRESYRRMYRQIGRAVRAAAPGDSLERVRVSAGAVLDLEADFQRLIARRTNSLSLGRPVGGE